MYNVITIWVCSSQTRNVEEKVPNEFHRHEVFQKAPRRRQQRQLTAGADEAWQGDSRDGHVEQGLKKEPERRVTFQGDFGVIYGKYMEIMVTRESL